MFWLCNPPQTIVNVRIEERLSPCVAVTVCSDIKVHTGKFVSGHSLNLLAYTYSTLIVIQPFLYSLLLHYMLHPHTYIPSHLLIVQKHSVNKDRHPAAASLFVAACVDTVTDSSHLVK